VAVLVLEASEDAEDTGADHLQEAVLRDVGVAGGAQISSKCLCEPEALVELPDREQAGVAGQLARRRLDDERRAEEVEDLEPDPW
jgi:hypothetical protein